MALIKCSNTNKHKIINIFGLKIKLKKPKPQYNFVIDPENNVQISPLINKQLLNLYIKGKNNTVIINELYIGEMLTISMYAENSTLVIGKGCGFNNLKIIMGRDTVNTSILKNAKLEIGERVSIEGALISVSCGNTELSIGNDCMFSDGISILNSDSHPIYNQGTKYIINRSKDLRIGNHCWLGKNVIISKNTILPDDTIVGCGSIVTGIFTDSNTAIAGNPAKVIKKNLDWHMNGSGDYTDNIIQD